MKSAEETGEIVARFLKLVSQMMAKLFGSLKGSGFSSMEFTMLKMAVFAPIPSARVSVAAAAKPGFLRSIRVPWRASCQNVSELEKAAISRDLSHVCRF
jgi:hypothetical protein